MASKVVSTIRRRGAESSAAVAAEPHSAADGRSPAGGFSAAVAQFETPATPAARLIVFFSFRARPRVISLRLTLSDSSAAQLERSDESDTVDARVILVSRP